MTSPAASRAAVLDAAAHHGLSCEHDGPQQEPDDWSLEPHSLSFLSCLVQALQPESVLELGSGASTVVLGTSVSALANRGRVVAIESDPAHYALTQEQIEANGLQSAVRLVAAHIVARRLHGRYVPTYLAETTDEGDPLRPGWADLVLVDGPPLPLGGREGALYQALRAARCGAVVVLDDSRRDSERQLLRRMLDVFEGSIEASNLLGFGKGLAVILVTAPIDPKQP